MAHDPHMSAGGAVVRDESGDDPNSGLTVYYGLLGCVLLFVIIVALQVVFNAMVREEYEAKTYHSVPPALEQMQNEHTATLNSYGWVDQSSGVARIPIDRAMELVSKELN